MASVYSAFTNPTAVPQIDTSQLLQTPVVNNQQIGIHATAIQTEETNETGLKNAKKSIDALLGKFTSQNPVVFKVLGAKLFENDPAAAEYGQGMFVYILDGSSVAHAVQKTVAFLKERAQVRVRSVGDGNNLYHVSMYYKPVQPDQQEILLRLMNEKKNAGDGQFVFGNVYAGVSTKRSSMNKVSFNKVGVKQYREHLASLSEKDLVDVFADVDDEFGVDEFGDKTSASMLAADELLLRSGVVIDTDDLAPDEDCGEKEIESMKNYASHMQRIASSRGIVSSADEDLFR